MSNKERAYRPFENIKARLDEIAEEFGLECERMVVHMDSTIEVIWSITAEAVMTDNEKKQRKFEEDFESISLSFEDDPFEDKSRQAIESLKEMLEKFDD